MAIEKFEKQPYEEFVIGADFKANFEEGVTIVSQIVTARNKAGLDVTAIVLDTNTITVDDGVVVKILVRAGDTDKKVQPYKISFRIVDSADNKWELDVSMVVKEL